MFEAVALNLPLLLGAAVIDSINPCAFGVLIFLLAYLNRLFGTSRQLLIHGIAYITAVFLTYLVAGLLLLPIIRELGNIATTAYIVIGVLVILAGILQLKDAFWYGRGPSLTIFPSAAKRIELYVKKVSKRLSTAFFLGMFVALVELPCTGAVYIAVLALMSLSGFTFSTITSLILYNAVFVLPLFVILFAVYKGANTRRLELWREKYRSLMRLAIGLLLIGLGVWMIIFVF